MHWRTKYLIFAVSTFLMTVTGTWGVFHAAMVDETNAYEHCRTDQWGACSPPDPAEMLVTSVTLGLCVLMYTLLTSAVIGSVYAGIFGRHKDGFDHSSMGTGLLIGWAISTALLALGAIELFRWL